MWSVASRGPRLRLANGDSRPGATVQVTRPASGPIIIGEDQIRIGRGIPCRARAKADIVLGTPSPETGHSGTGSSQMRPPIFVFAGGDVDIFESVEDAVRYIEWPSGVEERTVAYDSEG